MPKREPLEYAFCPLARCPSCHGINLKTYRTLWQRDSDHVSVLRYTLCLEPHCGQRFKLVQD